MKTLFIINPIAGRGSSLKLWKRIESTVARTPAWDSVLPESAAAARAAAAEAARSGFARVITVGGDGTLDVVAGGLIGTETALGVIPAGTGNDFCRNLGIGIHPLDALAVATGPHIATIDVGRAASGACFLNAAGIGFDGQVAAIHSRFPKGLGGTAPYLLGALYTLVRWRSIPMEIRVDEQRIAGPMAMVAIANGRYYGGGMKIAPAASVSDGQFDVMIGGDLSPVELLGLLARVYPGTHVNHPKVRFLRGSHVEVVAGPEARSHLDGDLQPAEAALSFDLLPGTLKVAVP